MGMMFSKNKKCCGTCKNWDGIKFVKSVGMNVDVPDSKQYKCNVQMNGCTYCHRDGISCFKWVQKF